MRNFFSFMGLASPVLLHGAGQSFSASWGFLESICSQRDVFNEVKTIENVWECFFIEKKRRLESICSLRDVFSGVLSTQLGGLLLEK